MPFAIEPLVTIESSSRVNGLAFSTDKKGFAVIGTGGEIKFYSETGDLQNQIAISGRATNLNSSPEGGYVVGSIEENVHCFSSSGELLWQYEIPGGVEDLAVVRGLIICLSGAGEVFLIELSGKLRRQLSNTGCSAIFVAKTSGCIALLLEDACVRVIDQRGDTTYERQSRCDKGEHITACIFDNSGNLIVAREAVGMVAQDEDEVEVEWWNPLGQMLGKAGLRSRCTALCDSNSGLVAGTSEGGVFSIQMDNTSVEIWDFEYAITSITALGEDLLVSSWFYLYRIKISAPDSAINTSKHSNDWDIHEIRRQKEIGLSEDDGREAIWQIEHSGIIEYVAVSADETRLLLAGEDLNDYTGDEPSLLFDLAGEITWREDLPDEEGKWLAEIPAEMREDIVSDAGTYDAESSSSDDFMELLTEEEQAILAGNPQGLKPQTIGDDLLSALMDTGEDNGAGDSGGDGGDSAGGGDDGDGDDSGGSEHSQVLTPILQTTINEDLLASLSEDVESAQLAPYADAGEEQMLVAGDTEVTIALLDGSATFDPHDKVVGWAWKDSRGRVIGEQSKIRVKLALGRHRFELNVLDDDGVWTTDTTFVIVE